MVLPSAGEFDWSPLLVATVAATAGVWGWVHLRARRGADAGLAAGHASTTRGDGSMTGGGASRTGGGASSAAPADGARAAGSGTSRWRVAATVAGVALLAVALLSPVATLAGHYLLTAHLVQVTLVMGFVPALLLLGLPRRLPAAPRALRLAGRAAVHPACAIVLVNGVFFGWHAPALYDAALLHPSVYALQQVSLLLVSLAFWWAIVEPTGPGPWSMAGLLKLGYILLATIPQTFAGLLFALARHTFYAPYAAAPRVTGLDPLGDQQLAGALMAILSKLALFAAFSVILWRVLEAHSPEDEQGDDGNHGGGDDDRPLPAPPGSPAWLEHLRRGRTVPEPHPVLPRRGPAIPSGATPGPALPLVPASPVTPASAPERTPAAR